MHLSQLLSLSCFFDSVSFPPSRRLLVVMLFLPVGPSVVWLIRFSNDSERASARAPTPYSACSCGGPSSSIPILILPSLCRAPMCARSRARVARGLAANVCDSRANKRAGAGRPWTGRTLPVKHHWSSSRARVTPLYHQSSSHPRSWIYLELLWVVKGNDILPFFFLCLSLIFLISITFFLIFGVQEL